MKDKLKKEVLTLISCERLRKHLFVFFNQKTLSYDFISYKTKLILSQTCVYAFILDTKSA